MLRFSLVSLALAASTAPLLVLAGADGDFTEAAAKGLIPDAAGMPADDLHAVAQAGGMVNFQPKNGYSLTWLVLNYAPEPGGPKNPVSFKFLEDSSRPARIAGAISGPKNVFGKFRGTATVIQPEYITDCTAKVDGNTATGTVTFRAEKAYEGKVEYTARKKDGAWRIEEFRLPDLKVTVALGADGKWVKK